MKTSTLANILASAALAALAAGCGDSESASGPSGAELNSCLNDESLAQLVAQLPEGWTPSGYAAGNPELVDALCGGECTTREEGVALLEHWINYGAAEGRTFVPETVPGSSEELSSQDGGSQWTPSQGGGSQWTPSQPSFSSEAGTTSSSAAAHSGNRHGASGQQVMTWVAAYNHDKGLRLINSNSDKFAKGLTRLGLQYWVPTYSGGVSYHPDANDSKVNAMVSWAHQHHVAVLLCVYNGQSSWDWGLASSAFKAGSGETLANALIAEMERMGLDGIDVDLEGNGDMSSDRSAFNAFITTLATKVRARGKILTVDTFHSTCYNAPNVSWWSDWVNKVHNVHSMGYQDLYEGDGTSICNMTNAFRYSTQQRYGTQAGYPANGVLMGMPGWMDTWGSGGQGSSVTNHIAEASNIRTGVAIWSIDEFSSSGSWVSDATWNALAALKGDACGFGNDADCTWD